VTVLREAPWASARAAAHLIASRLEAEQAPVDELDGRVLGVDMHALCQLPSFDSSAMDGWAVSGEGPWRIVGDVAAGHPWEQVLQPGETVRIATGAVVPAGADAVLRWEDATTGERTVSGDVRVGADIRPAGEECRVGDVVARAGTDVTPALAGFLAATGHDSAEVIRRPRVALLLLGDELLTKGVPERGRVRDSLGPQLPGWIARSGAQVAAQAQIDDDADSVHRALREASRNADLVITTGGTADGPRDHVRGAIEALQGQLVVDRVAVRPGHPMLMASLHGAGSRPVPLVGLPGNPHSAIVGFATLAAPAIDALLGRSPSPLITVEAGEELHAPAGHTRLIAGNLRDGVFRLSPYGGSAMLRGLAQSTGFAVVSERSVPAGTDVAWLPLP
jgi:molybdopterin molybdotransferase